MASLPLPLRTLRLFFVSGFVLSVVGSVLGFIRLIKVMGAFEVIKPELRRFSDRSRHWVMRSFCRPKHWITMSREMMNLDRSAREVSIAHACADLPINGIKARCFLKSSWWTALLPLRQADQWRDEMHKQLGRLSTNYVQLDASTGDHFVWIDQPDIIVEAVRRILRTIES
jgi:hypothetical protein